MEKKKLFGASLEWKRERNSGLWVFFFSFKNVLFLNPSFPSFLSARLNLLSNLSCVNCDQFQDWIDPNSQFSTTASSSQWARPDRLIVPVINRQTWQISTRFQFNFKDFQFQQGRLGTFACSEIWKRFDLVFGQGPLHCCLTYILLRRLNENQTS